MDNIKIPKLARNRYNYVKGSDNSNEYITQSQMAMKTGGGGGNNGGNSINVQQQSVIQEMLSDKGFITYDKIKTVNGYSLVGDGDIAITSASTVDLSPYMTKAEMSSYVSQDDLERAGYLSQSYLDIKMEDYISRENAAVIFSDCVTYTYFDSKMDDYATKSYVTDSIESAVLDGIDMSSYATKVYVDANLNVHDDEMKTYVADYVTTYAPTADLSIYVTKVQLAAAGYLTQHQSLDAYATKSELEPLATKSYVNEQIESAVFDGVDMSAYATKAYVQQYVYSYSPTSDMSIYVTKVNLAAAGYLTQHQSLTAYAKKDELSAYATKSYVNEQIESAVFEGVDMSAYATKSYVEQYVYSYSPTSDLSIYVTKVQLAAAGYLTQHQSLDAYATKAELERTNSNLEKYVEEYVDSVAIDGVDMSAYVTKTQLSNASYATQAYVTNKISQIPTADLSSYATKSYVSEYVAAYAPEPDLSAYVTKTELSNASYATQSYVATECDAIKEACYAYADSKSYIPSIDLSSYATKTYVSEYVAAYAPEPDLSAYVTKTELDNASYLTIVETTYSQYNQMSYAEKTNGSIYVITDYDDTAYYVTSSDLESYASKQYVDTECEAIKQACYTYTDSKVVNQSDLSSYVSKTELESLVEAIIDTMKQNGDLVDATYVVTKINEGRT